MNQKTNAKSSDGLWAKGDTVYNDDHGYGSIISISECDDGPLVKIKFENGFEKSFLSRYQSSGYTKILDD